MLTKRITTGLFGAALLVILVNLTPQIARAQNCLGSRISYFVRDEKGKLIGEDVKDLWLDEKTDSGSRGWGVGWRDYSKKGQDDAERKDPLPASISNNRGKIATLGARQMCSFSPPVRLALKLHGKLMMLTFNTSGAHDQWYLVDALPFQEGAFEVTLPTIDARSSQFYPASHWKKSTDKAGNNTPIDWKEVKPDIPPPGSLRSISGRVVNAATGKPIADAKVYLKFKNSYVNARGVTDAKGAFTIDELRTDQIPKIFGVALSASHPDYAGDYVMVFEDDNGRPLESIRDVTIKLVPYITVTGRVIDETTGAVPPGTDKFYLSFDYGPANKLWNEEILGTSVNTKVKADGTFTIKTHAGRNRVYISDEADHYGGYALFPQTFQNVDIGQGGTSSLVLKVKKQRP